MIELYTDGACSPNPGLGGWAASFIKNNERHDAYGYEENSTNQRMEVTAAIQGINMVNELFPEEDKIIIYSDSQYLVNTMNFGWKRKANFQLWNYLDDKISKFKGDIEFVWVKGHANNINNQYVDDLAVRARTKKEKSLDIGLKKRIESVLCRKCCKCGSMLDNTYYIIEELYVCNNCYETYYNKKYNEIEMNRITNNLYKEIQSLQSNLKQIYSHLGVEAYGADIQEQAIKEIDKLKNKK